MQKYFSVFVCAFLALNIFLLNSSCNAPRFEIAGAYHDSIMRCFNSNTKIIQQLDSAIYRDNDVAKSEIIFNRAVDTCEKNLTYIKTIGDFEGDSAFKIFAVKFFTNDLNRVKRFHELIDLLKGNSIPLSADESDKFDAIYDLILDDSKTDCLAFEDAQRHFGDKHDLIIQR